MEAGAQSFHLPESRLGASSWHSQLIQSSFWVILGAFFVFFCNFCAQSYCVLSILRRQSTSSLVEKNTVVKAGVQKIGCYLETVFKVTVSRENRFCIFQMVSVKLLGFFVSTGCKTGFYFLHLTSRNLGRTLFDRYVSVCWLIGYDCYADCRTKIHLATVRVCQ